MEDSKVTAEWARKQATEVIGVKVKKQIADCLESIKIGVEKNEMSTAYLGPLEELTKQDLLKRGFKVDYVTADPRDPREVGYYNISW